MGDKSGKNPSQTSIQQHNVSRANLDHSQENLTRDHSHEMMISQLSSNPKLSHTPLDQHSGHQLKI